MHPCLPLLWAVTSNEPYVSANKTLYYNTLYVSHIPYFKE